MDWTSIGTIVATGGFTLLGVTVKGWLDDRADEKRRVFDAERADAALAHERESAREERVNRKSDEAQEAGRLALIGLTEILNQIAAYPEDIDSADLGARWHGHDARARQLVESIHENDLRDSMSQVLDALDSYATYVSANGLARQGTWNMEWLIKRLVSLAGCAARGDTVSGSLSQDLSLMRQRWQEVLDHWSMFD